MILNIALAASLIVGCGLFFGGLGGLTKTPTSLDNDAGIMGALAGVGAALIMLAIVGWLS
jgi:hypothetical protein